MALSQSVRAEAGNELDISLLDKTPVPHINDSTDGYEVMHNQLKLPPMTQEERDELLEAELPISFTAQEVVRPKYQMDASVLVVSLILLSRIVRNLELVGKTAKIRVMRELFKEWSMFLLDYMQAIPNLALHRKLIVNRVRYEVLAPPGMGRERLTRFLIMNAPRLVSGLILEHAGSEKLHGAIELDSDFHGETLIERFFRKSLFSDLRLPEFIRVLGDLWSSLSKAPYLSEALVWKLSFMYRRLLLSESEEEAFRRLFAMVLSQRSGARGKEISRREASEYQRLERQHLIQVMREGREG